MQLLRGIPFTIWFQIMFVQGFQCQWKDWQSVEHLCRTLFRPDRFVTFQNQNMHDFTHIAHTALKPCTSTSIMHSPTPTFTYTSEEWHLRHQ